MNTVEQFNAQFQRDNPQFFTTPQRYTPPNTPEFNAAVNRTLSGTTYTGPAYGSTSTTPLNTPATIPTTIPTMTPTPVINRSQSVYQQSLDAQANVANSYEDLLNQSKQYQAQQRQARIDAINQTFAPRISREKEAGAERMERMAILNTKLGVRDSGLDTQRSGGQQKLNEKALQDIEDTKSMAIQAAFDKADELALKETEIQYGMSVKGAEANVAATKNRYDDALKTLSTFSKAGNITSSQDLRNVDPNTYQTLKNVSGMSDPEIDAYLKVNAPEGTFQWSAAQVHGSKLVVPKMVNGKVTMETLDMGFTPVDPKDIDIQKSDSGIYLIDKSTGTWKLIPGSAGTSDSTGGFTLNSGQTRYDALGNIIATQPVKDYTSDLNDAAAFIKANPRVDIVEMKRIFLSNHPDKNKEWNDFIGE